MSGDDLHPLVARASDGELPEWAEAGEERRAHMDRVAELMERWARGLGLEETDVRRWKAAAYLHDSLRDAPTGDLRARAPSALAGLPDGVLHGPVAAERLREEGVTDEALLRAVASHTLGHPELDRLGRALFAADFLEPARDLENEWRARLRRRMPEELDAVVLEVLEKRMEHARRKRGAMRRPSEAFREALRRRPASAPGRGSETHG